MLYYLDYSIRYTSPRGLLLAFKFVIYLVPQVHVLYYTYSYIPDTGCRPGDFYFCDEDCCLTRISVEALYLRFVHDFVSFVVSGI